MTAIEVAGAVFGILGTLMLALKGKHAGWGFVAFLASNVAWVVFAVHHGHLGLLMQQMDFTGTSLLGAYNWLWKKP